MEDWHRFILDPSFRKTFFLRYSAEYRRGVPLLPSPNRYTFYVASATDPLVQSVPVSWGLSGVSDEGLEHQPWLPTLGDIDEKYVFGVPNDVLRYGQQISVDAQTYTVDGS